MYMYTHTRIILIKIRDPELSDHHLYFELEASMECTYTCIHMYMYMYMYMYM